MATLQKLRNMGPLLVIFVGLALFAFIAGDAVKLFDSHSIDTSVGTVGEKELDAMEYQQIYNELDCFCRVSGIEVVLNETKGTMHGFDIVQKAPTTKAAVAARIEYMKKNNFILSFLSLILCICLLRFFWIGAIFFIRKIIDATFLAPITSNYYR